jgi:hypothetical protein
MRIVSASNEETPSFQQHPNPYFLATLQSRITPAVPDLKASQPFIIEIFHPPRASPQQ